MNYEDLKKIGGALVVTIGYKGSERYEQRLYCVSDLEFENSITIGQMFNAVRELNGKSTTDYGDRWPVTYPVNVITQPGEERKFSGQFAKLISSFQNCTSDLARLELVCDQLGEDMLELISTEELKKRIDLHLNAA